MRLGKIQRDVVAYLSQCPVTGGVICSTTKAKEFRGYDLEQVERALAGLLRRGAIISWVIAGGESGSQARPYEIKTGHDGKRYIVFPNNYERENYEKRNPGEMDNYRPACFGQYDNAYCID